MIHFTQDDALMLRHTAEVMSDRISDGNDYSENDQNVVDRIERTGSGRQSLLITGDELDQQDALVLYRNVVHAELNAWVPDASQRLLQRVGHALGVRHPLFLTGNPDCGAEPGWHALHTDWIVGIFVRRCTTCGRVYKDGTTI